MFSSDAGLGGSRGEGREGGSRGGGEASEFGGRVAEAGFEGEGAGYGGYPSSEEGVLLCNRKKESATLISEGSAYRPQLPTHLLDLLHLVPVHDRVVLGFYYSLSAQQLDEHCILLASLRRDWRES